MPPAAKHITNMAHILLKSRCRHKQKGCPSAAFLLVDIDIVRGMKVLW
jgi:hypothetical protein